MQKQNRCNFWGSRQHDPARTCHYIRCESPSSPRKGKGVPLKRTGPRTAAGSPAPVTAERGEAPVGPGVAHTLALLLQARGKCNRNRPKRLVQCTEKALCLVKRVRSALWSFLVPLTFWPKNSFPWGRLMHWKGFSSTPGLCPPEANSGREPTYSEHVSGVTGENEKRVCSFADKNVTDFLGSPRES